MLLPALAIFILSFILGIKNLRISFLLLIILTPLVHKELFSLGGIWDLLPIRVAFGGIALSSVYHFFVWAKKAGYKRFLHSSLEALKKDPFLVLLLSLWLLRLLWIKKSASFDESFKLYIFYSSIVGIYFIFRNLYEKHGLKFIRKSIDLYLAMGFFAALIAVLQFYLRICCRFSVGGVWVVPGYTPRLGSTFWDVNHFGGYLVTMIPILFAMFFMKHKNRFAKFYYLFSAFFLSGILFFTQSRSSWMGLAVGLGLSLFIYYFSSLKKILYSFAILVLVGIVGLLSYTTYKHISINEKVASFMHYRLDSTDTHMLLLDGASEVYFDNFLIGAGYGNFDHAFRGTPISDIYFNREPKLKEMKVPPHSVWGEVLAETGSVGMTLYALFAGLILASLVVSIFTSKSNDVKYLGTGLLGGAVSIFVAGLFYSYNMEFYWIYLFICIGFSIMTIGKNRNLPYVLNWWSKNPITPYLIILPISAFYIFIRLGSTTLIDWDEAIYAKVAKNIVLSNDWLTLHWTDMKDYWFEKPPFYMWLTALAFKITGFNSFGARIVSATFGIFGIMATYKLGSKLYNKLTGITASLILLSTAHYLYYSRNGMLDVTATFFIVLSIFYFYRGLSLSDKRNAALISWLLSGASIGFAVMTKGIIGFIPLPIIFIYLLVLDIKNLKKYLKPFLFIVIGILLIAGPWHIYSLIKYGNDFWDTYFIDHMIGRGLSGFGHEKPVLWFLDVIRTSFRIWILPLFGALVLLPFFDKDRRQYYLLLISTFFVLIFFSVSKDKLQWYIMPIYPFIAILSARFIERSIYILNSFLRSEIRFDNKYSRILLVFCASLVAIFYVVIIRDKVYLSDFNKDKVALVEINNKNYPIEDYPDRKLYFSRIEPPVLRFYSDHVVKSVDEPTILRMIDDAGPLENYSFLVPDSVYYKLQSKGGRIKAPLVLDIKGTSGGWVLLKSVSRVELLRSQLETLMSRHKTFIDRLILGEKLTLLEKMAFDEINIEIADVSTKLTNYGYPPDPIEDPFYVK